MARWPIYLRQRGYRVFGLEWSHDACRDREGRPTPDWRCCGRTCARRPLAMRSVDAVLSLGVVEHEEAGPLEALREARRILKPGGILVLAVPYNNPLPASGAIPC